ncbi:protein FAM53B-like [Alosa sapidissima]|uniref:protein FAM53B-like n=1 Tax=Alosa sapidissima TaxID=34773 RepID=UPI001C09562F|nr:protein FAM53B-like [Alosa sapidissima]
MVILYSKTLEIKKGVDNHEPSTMSKGTALFSCSSVEGERWLALAGGCVQPESVHQEGGLWEALPAPPQPAVRTAASALTHLIQDLSLDEARASGLPHIHTHGHTHSNAAAPPSKRQCRSLSSDELMWGSGVGPGSRSSFSLSSSSPWRPQGSRVWSWVEKRRWHSGPPMQRSSSVSLPSRAHTHAHTHTHHHHHSHGRSATLPLDLQPMATTPLLLPLCHTDADAAGAGPQLGTEARAERGQGPLPRSRSQPCVLSEKKVAGMKRRRADEHSSQEARPSLDLAKMTQKQHFHSLSCPRFSFFETCHSPVDPPPSIIPSHSETTRTCPSGLGAGFGRGLHQRGGDGDGDSSNEEEDTDSACSVGSRCDTPNRGEEEEDEEEDEEHGTFWKGSSRAEEKDALCELDGELDIEQIERN